VSSFYSSEDDRRPNRNLCLKSEINSSSVIKGCVSLTPSAQTRVATFVMLTVNLTLS